MKYSFLIDRKSQEKIWRKFQKKKKCRKIIHDSFTMTTRSLTHHRFVAGEFTQDPEKTRIRAAFRKGNDVRNDVSIEKEYISKEIKLNKL